MILLSKASIIGPHDIHMHMHAFMQNVYLELLENESRESIKWPIANRLFFMKLNKSLRDGKSQQGDNIVDLGAERE